MMFLNDYFKESDTLYSLGIVMTGDAYCIAGSGHNRNEFSDKDKGSIANVSIWDWNGKSGKCIFRVNDKIYWTYFTGKEVKLFSKVGVK